MSRYYNDYYGLDSSSLELEHFGVLHQRKGVRRYQYEDGSLTPEGRVHYHVGPARKTIDAISSVIKKTAEKRRVSEEEKQKTLADQKAKEEAAKVEAEKKAAEDKARVEAEAKKKAVNSGVASEVMKYAGQMDNNELQYAVNRINLTQQLNAYNQKELDAANQKVFDTLAKVANTTLKVAGGVSQATTYYTNIRKNAPQIQKDFESLKKAINKKKG